MDAAAVVFSSASLLPLQILDFFPVLHQWCCERFMRKKKKNQNQKKNYLEQKPQE
jgi:hypothetical protein